MSNTTCSVDKFSTRWNNNYAKAKRRLKRKKKKEPKTVSNSTFELPLQLHIEHETNNSYDEKLKTTRQTAPHRPPSWSNAWRWRHFTSLHRFFTSRRDRRAYTPSQDFLQMWKAVRPHLPTCWEPWRKKIQLKFIFSKIEKQHRGNFGLVAFTKRSHFKVSMTDAKGTITLYSIIWESTAQ